MKSLKSISLYTLFTNFVTVTKTIRTCYVFINKFYEIIDLLKNNQNLLFPLAQCCTKPEKAMPDSADQHKHLFITRGKIYLKTAEQVFL